MKFIKQVLPYIATLLGGFLLGMMIVSNRTTDLDRCLVEDQVTPCYWDSQRSDPNDEGLDYIVVDEYTTIYTELSGKSIIKIDGHNYHLNKEQR